VQSSAAQCRPKKSAGQPNPEKVFFRPSPNGVVFSQQRKEKKRKEKKGWTTEEDWREKIRAGNSRRMNLLFFRKKPRSISI
jgi:hypothetical protein